jgi:YegS/Rv2252/BmrU family lipid kinase
MKICVIFNPMARGQKATRFREQLRQLAGECVLKATTSAGAGRALAAEAVREGFETIVAAGGDGTLNEVINGLAETPANLAHCRIAVLPLGTVNVFAREIEMPTRFRDAWEVIRSGHEIRIDLPTAEFLHAGELQRRCFVQMAGAGLDARAVELVSWKLKKRLGQFAYWIAALRALAEPKMKVRAEVAGQAIEGELVMVGNGRFYGGPYALFPLAEIQDGVLEVSIFPRANWLSLCRSVCGLFTDRLYTAGGVRNLRAPQVNLFGSSSTPFHLEGEKAGYLPVNFSVLPRALRMVVPGYLVDRLNRDRR